MNTVIGIAPHDQPHEMVVDINERGALPSETTIEMLVRLAADPERSVRQAALADVERLGAERTRTRRLRYEQELATWLVAVAQLPVARAELVSTLWARTRMRGVLENTLNVLCRSRDRQARAVASEVLAEVGRRRISPGFGL